jgi:pimeloyl-ACP methyl ester carboxylesterase
MLVPDLPGHGFSDGHARLTPGALFRATTEALDALATEPVVVVGNSLGGAAAIHYALARPEKVLALVLVSPAGAQATDEEWREIRRAFDVRSRTEASAFVRRLYHEPPWFAPLFVHEFPAALARPTMRRLLDAASNADAPSPEALSSLSMPILLLWGQSDRLLPERHLEYFTRHLPDHSVIERPVGLGHCPHFDAPTQLAARIVDFMRASGVTSTSIAAAAPSR